MRFDNLVLPPTNMPQIAYYYPNPVWDDGNWLKNLILFFDGIAILVPSYMKEKPFEDDPAISAGLHNEGLLHILDPEDFIDEEVGSALALVVLKALENNVFNYNPKDTIPFQQLSTSRLISKEDPELGKRLFDELKTRGLALPSDNGLSFPIHPDVRNLVLITLAQAIRSNSRSRNMEFFPVTDHPEIHDNFKKLLGLNNFSSKGHVVSLDLETVGVDLSLYPLDEILDFRRHHGDSYKEYAKKLRIFVRELSPLDDSEKMEALIDRQQEIKDIASDLRRFVPKEWRKALSLGFGLAGAAWTVHSGDWVGGILAFGAGAVSGYGASQDVVGSYSYIFEAKNRFTY